jgi:hypothetical protein
MNSFQLPFCSMNNPATSSPVSYTVGPIEGPITACISAGLVENSVAILCTVLAVIFARVPRQPACMAPATSSDRVVKQYRNTICRLNAKAQPWFPGDQRINITQSFCRIVFDDGDVGCMTLDWKNHVGRWYVKQAGKSFQVTLVVPATLKPDRCIPEILPCGGECLQMAEFP